MIPSTRILDTSNSLPIIRARRGAEAEAMDLLHLPDHISPFHEASGVSLVAVDFGTKA
jgi:hypothetical protein